MWKKILTNYIHTLNFVSYQNSRRTSRAGEMIVTKLAPASLADKYISDLLATSAVRDLNPFLPKRVKPVQNHQPCPWTTQKTAIQIAGSKVSPRAHRTTFAAALVAAAFILKNHAIVSRETISNCKNPSIQNGQTGFVRRRSRRGEGERYLSSSIVVLLFRSLIIVDD